MKSCAACGIECLLFFVSKRFELLLLPAAALPACRQPYAISAYFGFYQTCRSLPGRHCFARRGTHYRKGLHSDRRKLGCTCARLAERQRIIVAEANRIAKPMAASEAMPPRRYHHSPGAAPLRAASRQCNFLWVGQREGYLFLKKRYPSLIFAHNVRSSISFPKTPDTCA